MMMNTMLVELLQQVLQGRAVVLIRTILSTAILIVLLVNLLIGSLHPHFVHTQHQRVPQSHFPKQQQQQQVQVQVQAFSSTSSSIATAPLLQPQQQQLPPLESLVQGKNITGNVSFLLDFAIIGFPKCGTSSIMFHLQNHSQIKIFTDERCDLSYNKQAQLVHDLYNLSTSSSSVSTSTATSSSMNVNMNIRQGLKCPLDLENTQLALPTYRQIFPHTKFIIGIRHPILWMESFYNFRIHNGYQMPNPNKLIGKCFKSALNVCTFRSNFHLFLSSLGKTQMSTNPNEYQYVAKQYQRSIHPIPTTAKVFLYDVSQLRPDNDNGRELQFRIDLQNFLQLDQSIPPMIWFKPGRVRSVEFMQEVKKRQIDICHDEYLPLRTILLQQAINASTWITRYFMHHSDVTISSPGYFETNIMASWQRDPCIERRRE